MSEAELWLLMLTVWAAGAAVVYPIARLVGTKKDAAAMAATLWFCLPVWPVFVGAAWLCEQYAGLVERLLVKLHNWRVRSRR